jgi:hypothetical protein
MFLLALDRLLERHLLSRQINQGSVVLALL